MNREPADSRHVGEHFMEFAIDFFNLAKNSYHQQNQIRANSAAFQVLMQLNQPGRQAPTMSEMALQLGITKQQLTKLINDLEEKEPGPQTAQLQEPAPCISDDYTGRRIHHEAAEGSHAGVHGVPSFLV